MDWRLARVILLLFGTELVGMAGAAERPAAEPVVYCDLTPLCAPDLKDEAARWRFLTAFMTTEHFSKGTLHPRCMKSVL